MVTIKDIKARWPVATSVTQQGSKQLFVVCLPDKTILVSCHTIVGYRNAAGVWILTRYRYSVTTTRQLNQFARGHDVIWQDAEFDQ